MAIGGVVSYSCRIRKTCTLGLTLLDVSFLCGFASIATLISIIQQIHYAISWIDIKRAEYTRAVESLTIPALGFFGTAQELDVVLTDIRTCHHKFHNYINASTNEVGTNQ
jgi:hypothetical protein